MFSLLMYFVRNDKNKDDQSFKQDEALKHYLNHDVLVN